MEANCLSEPEFLSEPEESDSLCLFEDGGGGRRGTMGWGLDSGSVGCVSGFVLLREVRFDSSSRSREPSRTTTSPTSASSVTSSMCGASSHTDPVPEGSSDGDTSESLPSLSPSFCSSSSSPSSASIFLFSSPTDPSSPSSSSSSSLSSESPNPSCARALATFLR